MRCSNLQGKRDKNGGMAEYPCGFCLPCRITRRQQWTLRILLELRKHEFNYFITLTYNDQNIPENQSLDKTDLQKYWKRLRKNLSLLLPFTSYVTPKLGIPRKKPTPWPIRYFACGEYGERTARPHYHAIVFSDREIPLIWETRVRKNEKTGRYFTAEEVADSPFHKSWLADSIVDVRPIPSMQDGGRIARYVAAYTVKKMTNVKQMRLRHREEYCPALKKRIKVYWSDITEKRAPEFQAASRRPGIGLGQADDLARALAQYKIGSENNNFQQHEVEATTGLHMIRYDGKPWPVDRVLRQKIIEQIGGDHRTDIAKALQRQFKIKQRWREEHAEEKARHQNESEHQARRQAKIHKHKRYF